MSGGAARPPLVLASQSPRRRDLLAQIGLVPDRIAAAALDESPRKGELPHEHARRLAEAKARALAAAHPDAFVLAADTVVACGRRILPKAADSATARRCLMMLSGRRHRVLGGVCVAAPGGLVRTDLVATIVAFERLAEADIEAYLATEEWRDKAGGYAIQGRAATFIRFISGSYSNVVGLPLFETYRLLKGLGFRRADTP